LIAEDLEDVNVCLIDIPVFVNPDRLWLNGLKQQNTDDGAGPKRHFLTPSQKPIPATQN
jgi:hypothetical protein